jgi:hypothetical protein
LRIIQVDIPETRMRAMILKRIIILRDTMNELLTTFSIVIFREDYVKWVLSNLRGIQVDANPPEGNWSAG